MRHVIVLVLFAGALITLSNAQTPEWTNAQSLTVELSNFKFTPSALTLQHGTPYKIHFANSASGGHDFVAKEFFAGSTIAPEDRSKVKNGAIDLEGGETIDVRLVPNQPGTYKSHCSHFMHSSFGMTGTITVR